MFYDQGNFGRKRFRADKRRNGKFQKNASNQWTAADGAFRCANCRQMVFPTPQMGTAHRNHCPLCLHSLHVDTHPGDRAAICHARMAPVGLTMMRKGVDKYQRERLGDVMLVHVCAGCGIVNINRIAADDSCSEILEVFQRSLTLDTAKITTIEGAGVRLLTCTDATQLHEALFGRMPRA